MKTLSRSLILCLILNTGCSSNRVQSTGDIAPPLEDATLATSTPPDALPADALPTDGIPQTQDALPEVPTPEEMTQNVESRAQDVAQGVASDANNALDQAIQAEKSELGTGDETQKPVILSDEKMQVTVQPGDTLMKIAFETYGDLYEWKKIAQWNSDKIQNVNDVPPGTVLTLEKPSAPVVIDRNGDKYLIKKGDTLGTISQDVYGVSSRWRKLWENNRQLIRDPNRIFAGFYLYYMPDSTMAPQRLSQAESTETREPSSLSEGPSVPVSN